MAYKERESDGDLIFNKEIGKVNELQRLENIYHNFSILGMSSNAFRALKDLAKMVKPLLNDKEKLVMSLLQRKCCVPAPYPDRKGAIVWTYNEAAMDSFYDFVADMMMKYKLEFAKEDISDDGDDDE